MFYPQCPVCGGSSESAESSTRYSKHTFSSWVQQQAAAGHPHPYLKMGISVLLGVNEIYKRLPGGGRKRCKSCRHEFS